MFMAFLLQRNSQIESDLVDQLFNSSEKRLARLLIMLVQVGKGGTFQTVVAPISQEVLASRVGTTRSRINSFLNKFRKLGPHRVQRQTEGAFVACERDRSGVAPGPHAAVDMCSASRAVMPSRR
jgi:hypothetical protein